MVGIFRIHAKKLRAGKRVEGTEHEERPERQKLRRAILTALMATAEKLCRNVEFRGKIRLGRTWQ
jgi:hypothetical protein